MEKVAHGIYEDSARPAPTERVRQAVLPNLEIEAQLVRMSDNTTETLGEALSIAIVTTARHSSCNP